MQADLEGSDFGGINISYHAIAIIKMWSDKNSDWVGTVKRDTRITDSSRQEF